MNVLLVEDDVYLRDMFVELFRMDGHEVTTAENAVVACKFLERNDYDLVLTDNDMPRNGCVTSDEGMQVVEIANTVPYRPRIVWMSGRAAGDPALVQKALDTGADEVLNKPFTPDEFRTMVQRASARKTLEVMPL